MPPINQIKVMCRNCKKNTNHVIVRDYGRTIFEEISGVDWHETFQILQCMGCEAVSYRSTSQCSEDYVSELIDMYPNPMTGRQPIENYLEFPRTTTNVYIETLKALNNQAPILAAIGLRSVIESVCLDQKTTASNLEKKIDELVTKGLLATKQAEFLHSLRFMGNAAAHEIVPPNQHDLEAALDIAETLLKTIYILPIRSNQIQKHKKGSP